jgi:hypothetical protein
MLGALSTDRAAGKALATIQNGALLERSEDEALRNLAIARMSDLGMATRHGIDETDAIIRELASRISQDGFGAQALASIGEEGVQALRRELRRLSEGR